MIKHFLLLAVAVAIGLSAPGALAEDAPAMPETVIVKGIRDPEMIDYKSVVKRMKQFDALRETDKIYLRFFMVPKAKDANISDFRVRLEGKEFEMSVPVEADGTVRLPFSEQALAAEAEVVTNQKAGTLDIYYGPGIKVPEGLSFKYRDVMDGVKQSTSMMKKFWTFLFPSFKGASLRYTKADGQFMIIHAKAGEDKRTIDLARKSIALELDSDLYEENPQITVSERPAKIAPYNVAPDKPKN